MIKLLRHLVLMERFSVLPPADPVPVHHHGAAVPHLPAHQEAEGVVPLHISRTASSVPISAGDLLLLIHRHHVPGDTFRLLVLLVLVLWEPWLVAATTTLVWWLVVVAGYLVWFGLELVAPLLYLLWLWTARQGARNLLNHTIILRTLGTHFPHHVHRLGSSGRNNLPLLLVWMRRALLHLEIRRTIWHLLGLEEIWI